MTPPMVRTEADWKNLLSPFAEVATVHHIREEGTSAILVWTERDLAETELDNLQTQLQSALDPETPYPLDIALAARCHPILIALFLRHGECVYGPEREKDMPEEVYARWVATVDEENAG